MKDDVRIPLIFAVDTIFYLVPIIYGLFLLVRCIVHQCQAKCKQYLELKQSHSRLQVQNC
jgi:hypothetical protein